MRQVFEQKFNALPAIWIKAPGRVNLIGEHTDYNGGFALPMAIDRHVVLALRPRNDRRVTIYSLEFDSTLEFSLDAPAKRNTGWDAYVQGLAWALNCDGYDLHGWDGVVWGDLPMGAGLSSSAALEMAVARAFSAVGGFAWEPAAMARAGQRTENEWVGVDCGIMDQLVCAGGVSGHALLIDCRALTFDPVPMPANTAVVILDTGTRRGLVDSAYNERRQQCESAVHYFKVDALRDVTAEMLGDPSGELDQVVRQRARHVVTENARTLEAAAALEAQDARAFGGLMRASHRSLRDDFEVSSAALDHMAVCASKIPGCYGARMTGGGFGGCAVALVAVGALDTFTSQVTQCYRDATGKTPELFVCRPSQGAHVVM